MVERGVFVGGDRLRPVADATSVRVRDGETLVSDGPFAETKEFVAGYTVDRVRRPRRGARGRGQAPRGRASAPSRCGPSGSREPRRPPTRRRRRGGGGRLPPRVGTGRGHPHRRDGGLGPGRGVRPGRLRRRAAGVAPGRRPLLAGGVAHDDGPQRRHRSVAPAGGGRRQAAGRGDARARRTGRGRRGSGRRPRPSRVGRGGCRRRELRHRRPAPPHLHVLPPGAAPRGAGGAHAADPGRPDDRRDRPGLPRHGGGDVAASGAGQAQDPPRRHPVPRAAGAPAARADLGRARRGLPAVQRGVRRLVGERPPAPAAQCRGDPPGAAAAGS